MALFMNRFDFCKFFSSNNDYRSNMDLYSFKIFLQLVKSKRYEDFIKLFESTKTVNVNHLFTFPEMITLFFEYNEFFIEIFGKVQNLNLKFVSIDDSILKVFDILFNIDPKINFSINLNDQEFSDDVLNPVLSKLLNIESFSKFNTLMNCFKQQFLNTKFLNTNLGCRV